MFRNVAVFLNLIVERFIRLAMYSQITDEKPGRHFFDVNFKDCILEFLKNMENDQNLDPNGFICFDFNLDFDKIEKENNKKFKDY